jgi:hypothetical protein
VEVSAQPFPAAVKKSFQGYTGGQGIFRFLKIANARKKGQYTLR